MIFLDESISSHHATGAKNRSRLKIGPGIYVESVPSAPTNLFYTTYVEPVVEKETRSIQIEYGSSLLNVFIQRFYKKTMTSPTNK
jgi:hypothetical protein